jgi:hypothetical protein
VKVIFKDSTVADNVTKIIDNSDEKITLELEEYGRTRTIIVSIEHIASIRIGKFHFLLGKAN